MSDQKGNGCPHCAGDGWVYTSSLSGPERDGCPADCHGDPIVEVEVDVYEAAARIVRATVGRDLTEAEAERLRAMTDAGMFRAAWER